MHQVRDQRGAPPPGGQPSRTRWPGWAVWRERRAARPWTVGLEEEVVLLDGGTGGVANRAEEVLALLPAALAQRASAETHACVLELKTSPHATVAEAVSELAAVRTAVDRLLRERLGLRAAAAGTHPLAAGSEVRVTRTSRYRLVEETMRALANREPTMALHVHVAVPNPGAAVRALDAVREDLPLVLALSANSPFWRAADSGFASIRLPLLAMFPRFGVPRPFGAYGAYVGAVESLVSAGAIPDAGFIWWDVRLQPRLGTVEVRIADAQSCVRDVAALAALVQCLIAGHASGRRAAGAGPEVIDENRFLAARDGTDALLIDARDGRPRPALELLGRMRERCLPVAAELACEAELDAVAALAADPGWARQRRRAAAEGLSALPLWLADDFVGHRGRAELAAVAPPPAGPHPIEEVFRAP